MAQEGDQRRGRALGGLEDDVAGETVGGDDVDLAGEEIAPLDVAEVLERRAALAEAAEDLVRRAGELGALALLGAVGQEPEARPRLSGRRLGEGAAEDAELREH